MAPKEDWLRAIQHAISGYGETGRMSNTLDGGVREYTATAQGILHDLDSLAAETSKVAEGAVRNFIEQKIREMGTRLVNGTNQLTANNQGIQQSNEGNRGRTNQAFGSSETSQALRAIESAHSAINEACGQAAQPIVLARTKADRIAAQMPEVTVDAVQQAAYKAAAAQVARIRGLIQDSLAAAQSVGSATNRQRGAVAAQIEAAQVAAQKVAAL